MLILNPVALKVDGFIGDSPNHVYITRLYNHLLMDHSQLLLVFAKSYSSQTEATTKDGCK